VIRWSPWRRAILALSLAAVCWPAAAGAVDLPVDHWAYHYLDRMKIKGLLPEWLNGTRPLDREEMAAAVLTLAEAVEGDHSRITGVERQRLRWLEREFAEELRVMGE
jgi:hypothetical protein